MPNRDLADPARRKEEQKLTDGESQLSKLEEKRAAKDAERLEVTHYSVLLQSTAVGEGRNKPILKQASVICKPQQSRIQLSAFWGLTILLSGA